MHRAIFFYCCCLAFVWVNRTASADEAVVTAGDGVTQSPPAAEVGRLLTEYCLDCHSPHDPEAGLDLESILTQPLASHNELWEKVVRKLRTRQMPPSSSSRPSDREYQAVTQAVEQTLDRNAREFPQPGRPNSLRRLTRTEYQYAIRDLLGLSIDAAALLPQDDISHGFDNITVGTLSPTLLQRYISAAQEISRLAVGRSHTSPGGVTFRIPPDVTQEEHVAGLPWGTRGGAVFAYTFPQDGEYEIEIRLTRDRNEEVEGLREPHELELLLDRATLQTFTVAPPNLEAAGADEYGKRPTHENVDRHLKLRVAIQAGPHDIGVTFVKNPSALLETYRQPLNVHYNMYRHPRIGPAIYQVAIAGPFAAQGAGDTPSRRRIFTSYPQATEAAERRASEERCATEIVSNLLRQACRKPLSEEDVARTLEVYREARQSGDFEYGIEKAIAAILVNPNFLFRIERDPIEIPAGTPYRLNDVELASRLSFFLWSSLPDEELLELAEQGRLSEPETLAQQTRRMLADARSQALVSNFASQWLYLRNLESITPDGRLFPDFDDNLRQAMRQETELFFESILREDRSVLELLQTDYTFLNERLAKHYGIPHVYGSQFRRVPLSPESDRGGLLRQASILTVTSYATRTSPVIRGKWVLENLLGTPPPPPPPDVPVLSDNSVAANLSVRERLAQHRADSVCASCHDLIDPIGFALENFDAVGRWRDREGDEAVDASGGLPDGSQFEGAAGLEQGLLAHPELFVGTLAEKLLTYATGRGPEPTDGPAIRQMVRAARAEDYRLSSLLLAVVQSTPFQMRVSQ